jgi:hypothetical protein
VPFIDSRLCPAGQTGTILDDFKSPNSSDRVGESGNSASERVVIFQQAKPRFRTAFVLRVGSVRGASEAGRFFAYRARAAKTIPGWTKSTGTMWSGRDRQKSHRNRY